MSEKNGENRSSEERATLMDHKLLPKIQPSINTPLDAENGKNHQQQFGSSLRQVSAAFVAQLGTVNTGMTFGFSAIALPQLNATAEAIVDSSVVLNDTQGNYFNCSIINETLYNCSTYSSSIRIDESQGSWIASMSSIGTPIGCLLTGYLMDLLGRKRSLIITEVPAFLGWLLIAFATNVEAIYAGRFFVGLGSGMVGAPARVYTSEVTQPHLRGMLIALASVGVSTGVLIEYALGSILHWKVVAGISSLIPLAALILMFAFPETPSYLISRSKPEEARRALRQFRGSKYDLDREMETLVNFSKKNNLKRLTGFREIFQALTKPNALKPFAILVIYFLIYQWSGTNAVTFYAVEIFKASGTSINGYLATVILGVARLLSTVAACILCRRCGRRPLTLISSVGCGLSMLGMGGYEWLREYWVHNDVTPTWTWIPVFCMFSYTVACTLGFLVVPWVMIGEVYPVQVRGIIGGITTMTAHSFIFMVVYSFRVLKDSLTEHGTYLLFGSISFFGSIYFYVCLPETKNKSLQEIEDYFSGRPSTVKTGKIFWRRQKVAPVEKN
ncbi:facilitated trehalose transporter Tret1-like isoform X2 [Fopius arisanus]|uniref:Facilitated trehalose transporter Tret1-like isoform X2 n=1 Tax=Fopius arisanus TaxID=64838 RepID=A0A9R1SUK5_9HYME|nr:PREDICTED: facilitated trehalose transporter Tret1-like isoform X2 [Fopius arisanus]